jgi:hypothetical protein
MTNNEVTEFPFTLFEPEDEDGWACIIGRISACNQEAAELKLEMGIQQGTYPAGSSVWPKGKYA